MCSVIECYCSAALTSVSDKFVLADSLVLSNLINCEMGSYN